MAWTETYISSYSPGLHASLFGEDMPQRGTAFHRLTAQEPATPPRCQDNSLRRKADIPAENDSETSSADIHQPSLEHQVNANSVGLLRTPQGLPDLQLHSISSGTPSAGPSPRYLHVQVHPFPPPHVPPQDKNSNAVSTQQVESTASEGDLRGDELNTDIQSQHASQMSMSETTSKQPSQQIKRV